MSQNHLKERKDLAEKILAEAPRMKGGDAFTFDCRPGISCFNVCCADVNIVLMPLDILRISRRLGMSTTDFLAKHTFVPFSEEVKLPVVFLKMEDNEKKTCPFVTEEGCSIYEDRPWPCRMYPVGQASPEESSPQEGFYFLMSEDHCNGHKEKRQWTVDEWLSDQGVKEYEQMGKLFKDIILHPYIFSRQLDPARMEMFYMASYDLDKFRKFVFESKFLKRFNLDPGLTETIRASDKELMKFAFRWLRFALFGEMTIEPNRELLSEREREVLENRK